MLHHACIACLVYIALGFIFYRKVIKTFPIREAEGEETQITIFVHLIGNRISVAKHPKNGLLNYVVSAQLIGIKISASQRDESR